jgi:hypothetical protein
MTWPTLFLVALAIAIFATITAKVIVHFVEHFRRIRRAHAQFDQDRARIRESIDRAGRVG